MSEKKFQVFISSTFEDLAPERLLVAKVLRDIGCFPAGMEDWGAVGIDAFEYITSIIDECDYFLLISAGRYGTIHKGTQKSFTEMEYDYAVSCGMRPLTLLHRNPFQDLPGRLIENDKEHKGALEAFRDRLVADSLVGWYTDQTTLAVEAIKAINYAKANLPARGYMRADSAASKKEAPPEEPVGKWPSDLQLKSVVEATTQRCNRVYAVDHLKPEIWLSAPGYYWVGLQGRQFTKRNYSSESRQWRIKISPQVFRALERSHLNARTFLRWSSDRNPSYLKRDTAGSSDVLVEKTDNPTLEICRILIWDPDCLKESYARLLIDFHHSFHMPLFFLSKDRVEEYLKVKRLSGYDYIIGVQSSHTPDNSDNDDFDGGLWDERQPVLLPSDVKHHVNLLDNFHSLLARPDILLATEAQRIVIDGRWEEYAQYTQHAAPPSTEEL